MLVLYTAATPNGFKVSIALEELGLPYEVKHVDLRHGEQFAPDFLRISPNNKIPAIVDGETSVFESGAILTYLADKTGKLLPASGPARYRALEWMFFQVGHVGPMMGQSNHFRRYAQEKIPYAVDRYTSEVHRLYGVVDGRLGESRYLAGDEYTMADILNFPWLRLYKGHDVDLAHFPHVARWLDELHARPAVQRGLAVPPHDDRPMDEKAREMLFGKTQYQRRA